MATFTAKTFNNQTLQVDGHEYVGCTFNGCRLTYSGGAVPMFTDFKMEGCTFALEDAADRTIAFLTSLARTGSGGVSMVKELFFGLL